MIRSELRQTVFHIEPIKSIVGTGRSTAFQVWPEAGETIGSLGNVLEPSQFSAANDEALSATREAPVPNARETGWLRRLFSAKT